MIDVRVIQFTYSHFSWAGLVLYSVKQYLTNNCPSWISEEKERITVWIISWSISLKLRGWAGIRTRYPCICSWTPYRLRCQCAGRHPAEISKIRNVLRMMLNPGLFLAQHYIEPQYPKTTFKHVHPTKTQISLRIRAVWSESSLSAFRKIVSLTIENAPSEDSDQTAQMRRLIWIFAGRTFTKARFLTLRFIFSVFQASSVRTGMWWEHGIITTSGNQSQS